MGRSCHRHEWEQGMGVGCKLKMYRLVRLGRPQQCWVERYGLNWLKSSSCHWLRSRWPVPGVSSSQEARLISPPSESLSSWTEENHIKQNWIYLEDKTQRREKLRIQRIKQRGSPGLLTTLQTRPQPLSLGFTQISKLSHLRAGRHGSSVFLKYDLFLSSPRTPSRHLYSLPPLLWGHSATERLGRHGNHM